MFEAYRIRNDIKLAADVPQTDLVRLSAAKSENAALREKLQKYMENEKIILAQNAELRKRLETPAAATTTTSTRQQAQTAASSAATTAAKAGTSTATSARSGSVPSPNGTPGTTVQGENGVRYYYVGKGEGLLVIAQKMYGKAAMWKIIQEANKDSLDERGPRYGQMLIIPPAPQQ